MNKAHIIQELWSRGELSWKLYKHQKPIYNKIREVLASTDVEVNSHYLDISRQYGKSFTLFLTAVEECLRYKDHIVCYIAPMKSQALEIVTQRTFNTIFQDCPPNLMPKLSAKAELEFPNGSRIRISGSDNKHYESLRGGPSNLNILDETGFMDNLLDGVLATTDPMLKTTKGKTLYASTPAATMDHDSEIVYKQHLELDAVTTFTIYDDKSMSDADIQREINKCQGAHTTKFKREYLCEHISDASKQVIGEYTKEKVIESLLPDTDYKLDPLYKYWKKLVVLDWGGIDKTAILFAHYNYHRRTVVIEDHLDLQGKDVHIGQIADSVLRKVEELWKPEEQTDGIAYWCDNNNVIATQDLNINYGIPFVRTSKGPLEGMVQKVKVWVYENRIKYAPAAEFALKSAESAHWSPQRDKFAQSKVYGHYDHTAALVYLIRNIEEYKNPVPVLLGVGGTEYFVSPELRRESIAQNSQLSQVFKYNPRTRERGQR